MQAPDVQQVEQWIAGDGQPPDYTALKTFALELAEQRQATRAKAVAEGKLLRALAVLLYKRGGWTNQSDILRTLHLNRRTLDADLEDAGMPANKHTPRWAATEQDG